MIYYTNFLFYSFLYNFHIHRLQICIFILMESCRNRRYKITGVIPVFLTATGKITTINRKLFLIHVKIFSSITDLM